MVVRKDCSIGTDLLGINLTAVTYRLGEEAAIPERYSSLLSSCKIASLIRKETVRRITNG